MIKAPPESEVVLLSNPPSLFFHVAAQLKGRNRHVVNASGYVYELCTEPLDVTLERFLILLIDGKKIIRSLPNFNVDGEITDEFFHKFIIPINTSSW